MIAPVIRNLAPLDNPKLAQVYRFVIPGRWIRLSGMARLMHISSSVARRYLTLLCTRVLVNAEIETRVGPREGRKVPLMEIRMVIKPEKGQVLRKKKQKIARHPAGRAGVASGRNAK